LIVREVVVYLFHETEKSIRDENHLVDDDSDNKNSFGNERAIVVRIMIVVVVPGGVIG